MRLRTLGAVGAARLAGWASRLSGHGGSSLPGLIARRIDPLVLRRLAGGLTWGSVIVTGTNGKTTTTAMVRDMLERANRRVLTNRAGANMILGLTTSFVIPSGSSPGAAEIALLETDEATMPEASHELSPRAVLVTNFFRDQLDRYGELSTTVGLVARGLQGLSPDGTLALNADDPQVADLGSSDQRRVYFGMGDSFVPELREDDAGDARYCPRCDGALHYRRRFYAHIGDYDCPRCGWERPPLDLRIEWWDRARQEMGVTWQGEARVFPWRLPGLYNLYNQAGAIALALTLAVPLATVQESLAEFRPAFGRMERLSAGSAEIWLALVKNPVGFNQVLAALADDHDAPYSVMILINDRYADGQDVSWLWDVDFEHWVDRVTPEHWYVGGTRGLDMAVRLKYAGIARERVTVDASITGLLARATGAGAASRLYVLPTYTAMLEFRRQMTDRGWAPHFREG